MRQANYVVTGMTKMCVAFEIANGGFYLFTFSFILQKLDANIFALLYFSDASSSGVCFPDHEADVFS